MPWKGPQTPAKPQKTKGHLGGVLFFRGLQHLGVVVNAPVESPLEAQIGAGSLGRTPQLAILWSSLYTCLLKSNKTC